jgi:hypothetical protein
MLQVKERSKEKLRNDRNEFPQSGRRIHNDGSLRYQTILGRKRHNTVIK